MLLEYFCLFVFILRLFHVWCFAAGVKFWRDKKNVIFLSIIVVRFLLTIKRTYCRYCIDKGIACDPHAMAIFLCVKITSHFHA